jgi:uncharacterized protein YeaO (DUF488 family)
MPVKTKSYRDPVEDSDGERYLISRYWARGRKKVDLRIVAWIRDLGPSKELHRDLYPKDKSKKRISEGEYTKRYNQEISSRPKAQEVLAELRRKHNQGQTITLICRCEEGDFCHRHLVKKMIIAGNS